MTTTFRSVLGMMLVLGVLATPGAAQSFGYFGDNGPAHWGDLSASWKTCSSGKTQSPVRFEYRPRLSPRLAIRYGNTTGEIFNNGHTIEVETEGHNTLMLGGVAYELVQFHFHTPSEHRLKGRGFDLELHLVHKSATGALAVIGVFLKRGASSGSLTPIFKNLPNDINVKHPLERPFNPARFLPTTQIHYRYAGSLTTPPCTEGVQWIVIRKPVTVSDEDLAQVVERIHFNARPVQNDDHGKRSFDH